jgi:hypothetical protein
MVNIGRMYVVMNSCVEPWGSNTAGKFIRYEDYYRLQRMSMTDEWRLLGCYAVWLLLRTDVSEELTPPSSG